MSVHFTASLPTILEDMKNRTEAGLKRRIKDSLWPKLVQKKSTGKNTEREQDYQGMAPLSVWPEGAPRPAQGFVEGWAQAYSQFQFATSSEITKPMLKFEQAGLMKKLAQRQMDSSQRSKEIQIAAIYEYGHTGATVPTAGGVPIIKQTAGDGQAIFSTAHTWRNSNQTWSNLSTASDDLNEASLESHATNLRRIKNEHGMPIPLFARELLLPPELELKAIKLLDSRLEPNSANNAVNTAKRFLSGGYMINEYLSNTGDWYILTDAREGLPVVYMGWEDEVETVEKNVNGNACMYLDYSWAHGVNIPFGAYKVS